MLKDAVCTSASTPDVAAAICCATVGAPLRHAARCAHLSWPAAVLAPSHAANPAVAFRWRRRGDSSDGGGGGGDAVDVGRAAALSSVSVSSSQAAEQASSGPGWASMSSPCSFLLGFHSDTYRAKKSTMSSILHVRGPALKILAFRNSCKMTEEYSPRIARHKYPSLSQNTFQ